MATKTGYFFLARYALTNGVEFVEATADVSGKFIIGVEGRPRFATYKLGTDAFLTLNEALIAARLLRDKKIAHLRRQIEKLEAMNFGDDDCE